MSDEMKSETAGEILDCSMSEVEKMKKLLAEGIENVEELLAENKRLKLAGNSRKSTQELLDVVILTLAGEVYRLKRTIREQELAS